MADEEIITLEKTRKGVFGKPPDIVRSIPILNDDLFAIKTLMSSEEPVRRFVRVKRMLVVKYGFGDSSGTGFGSFYTESQSKLNYRFGVWGSDKEDESYNFKNS